MAQLEVLYNAECPICRREIEHYKRISGDDLAYVEITAQTAADWGLSEDQAAKQLHVRRGAQISVGVEAFVAIWRQLPYFWILAPIVNFKPIKAVSVTDENIDNDLRKLGLDPNQVDLQALVEQAAGRLV